MTEETADQRNKREIKEAIRRIVRTPDGQFLLEQFLKRYLYAPINPRLDDGALRAHVEIRNLALQIKQQAEETQSARSEVPRATTGRSRRTSGGGKRPRRGIPD